MRKLIGKNWLVFLLIGGYFLIRLPNLGKLPIFNDESIYLHWSQIVREKHDFFYPTYLDGKQPLPIWLFAYLRLWADNLLLSGRLVSVLFGLGATLGVFFAAQKMFGQKIAFWAALFYLIIPYNFFFERMALMEAMLSFVAVWSFYLTYLILEKPQLKLTIVLGIFLGMGMWIKSSAIFFVLLTYLTFSAAFFLKKGDKRYLMVLVYSTIIHFVIFMPLFFEATYPRITQKNLAFRLSFNEVFSFPFETWLFNLKHYGSWLFYYLTPVLFFLGLLGLRKSLLSFWFGLPVLAAILFSRNPYSRYLVLATPFWALLIGQTLKTWGKKKIIVFFTALAFILCLFYDSLLLIKPERFFDYFPKNKPILADKWQYVTGWPSGYGVLPAMNYLINLSQEEKIKVGVRSDSGNPEDAVYVYLLGKPNVSFFRYPLPLKKIDKYLFPEADHQSLVVTRDNQYGNLENHLQEIKKFYKPGGESYVGLYQLEK